MRFISSQGTSDVLNLSEFDGHTTGPWRWFGHKTVYDLYLATVDRGRLFVMQFRRWGTQGAQPVFQVHDEKAYGRMTPASALLDFQEHNGVILGINHPDARLIAAAPQLLDACKRMRRVIKGVLPYITDIAAADLVADAQALLEDVRP